MPATLLEARGIRATAFRPQAIARRKGGGLLAPRQSCGARATAFRPPGNRAAQGRRPSGPREIARRKGGFLSAPRQSRGKRAAAFRPPDNCAAQGWRPSGPRAIARREGGVSDEARFLAGNAAFWGPPGWGSRGTGEENPPGRGTWLGGFGKREGDQWESLVETSGRCSRSSRSVRPSPGASSRWMWPSRMPMSPSMISGKVR